MTRLRVNPGACGLIAELAAEGQDDGRVAVTVETSCKLVAGWAERLEPIEPYTLLAVPGGAEPVRCTSCHAACPLPVAVLKAIEAEAGLALPGDVEIRFLMD